MAKGLREAATLAASGQSEDVIGTKVDIILHGTWVGTVKLQVYAGATSGWKDTGDEWTANGHDVAESATPHRFRLDFTRSSGTLEYDIRAGDL